MKKFAIAIICFGVAVPASSQSPVSDQSLVLETEEQYERSQAARGNAITAFRAGDLAAALERMKHALTDRPTNIALLSNALFLAAETEKIDDAVKFANQFTALSMVPGAGIQAKMKAKLPAIVWQRFSKEFEELLKPRGIAETLISVPTDHRLVEGVATDGNGTYFLSTVVSGTILSVKPDGTLSVLVNRDDHAVGSFFGIAYSRQEGALYATHGRVDQTPNMPEGEGQTGVMRINPKTGDMTGDWVLSGGTDGQQIADIAISPTGTVYATQAQGGGIYKINGDNLEKLDTKKQFRSPQGLAFLEGGALFMADYGRGLWRINAATEEASLLALPASISLIGIDGLFAHNGRLIAVQNGVSPHRIIEIKLNGTQDAVVDIKVLAQGMAEFDEPTLGTSTPEGLVFVASSQWPKYTPGGIVADGQTLNPTIVLRVPD